MKMVSFLWKTSQSQRDFGMLAVGTCNLEGRLPPLMAGSRPYAGRTWWKNDIPAIWCERIKMNDGHGDWKILFSNSNLTTPGRAGIEFEVALFDIESILVKKLLKSISNDKNI